ncbi:MAG: alcohol dehydrogenase catalytic domain-containing protein [Planctomycetota bacterium]
MKAVVLADRKPQFHDSFTEPTPQSPDEVKLRIKLAGICETDLQLVAGYMDFSGILGHEFVAIAEGGRFSGHRVVAEINCVCGDCKTCDKGRSTHCPNRTVIGIDRHPGAFAEFIYVPDRNLHPIPDSVSDDEAVFTEPLAAAFQILEQIDVARDDQIAILGDGRLGYLSAQVLATECDHVTVFGKHGTKLLRFGHHGFQTIQISSSHPEELPATQFDHVIDCTGSVSGLPMAIHLVRPRGNIVLKTTVAERYTIPLSALVINEIKLVGSRCGPFDRALHALEHRKIDVSELITDRFTLDDCVRAFERAANESAFKVVFDIS